MGAAGRHSAAQNGNGKVSRTASRIRSASSFGSQQEGFMGMIWRSISGGNRQPEEEDVPPSLEAHKAAFEGNAQKILHIARDTPELLREVSGEGETPAHHAAAGGQAHILSLVRSSALSATPWAQTFRCER